MSQYEEFFKDQLRTQADYDSVFWPKSRAKTMSEWEKKTVDGCATFFKASKYCYEFQPLYYCIILVVLFTIFSDTFFCSAYFLMKVYLDR